MKIKAANGKEMMAIDVFTASINFLKEHFIKNIKNRQAGNKITVDAVRWVLTVPAIWGDSAKQFMRESGEKVFVFFLACFLNILCRTVVYHTVIYSYTYSV